MKALRQLSLTIVCCALNSLIASNTQGADAKPSDVTLEMAPLVERARLELCSSKSGLERVKRNYLNLELSYQEVVPLGGSVSVKTLTVKDHQRVILTVTFSQCQIIAATRSYFHEDGLPYKDVTYLRSSFVMSQGDESKPSVSTLVFNPAYRTLRQIYGNCMPYFGRGEFKKILDFHKDISKILVAVDDKGVDFNDPRFAYRIPRDRHNNPKGFSMNGERAYPEPPIVGGPSYKHGNVVAGIVTSSPNALIVPIRWTPSKFGDELTPSLERDIAYADAAGARIVNMSFSTTPSTPGNARDEAARKLSTEVIEKHPKMLFVAAAGNNSTDLDQRPNNWNSGEVTNLIVVAAVDKNGQISPVSNYGKNQVQLAAPGIAEKETGNSQSYTSYAAPLVSATAADMLAVNPALTPEGIIEILLRTADRTPELEGKVAAGLLNHDRAVSEARKLRR